MLLSYLDESNASNLSDLGLIYLTLTPELLHLLSFSSPKKSHSGQIVCLFIENNNYWHYSIKVWDQNNVSRHKDQRPTGP
jgi:hypothetical protein